MDATGIALPGVLFAKLPDGTNRISTMNVDEVKQLKVLVENRNYTKL
jgi:hypothetical protein